MPITRTVSYAVVSVAETSPDRATALWVVKMADRTSPAARNIYYNFTADRSSKLVRHAIGSPLSVHLSVSCTSLLSSTCSGFPREATTSLLSRALGLPSRFPIHYVPLSTTHRLNDTVCACAVRP